METDFFSDFETIDMSVKGVRLPTVKIPEEYYLGAGIDPSSSNDELLKALCRKGLKDKLLYEKPEYIKRIKYEFETVVELGFTDYLLLIFDVMNYCKEQKIPYGLGRGSSAGSLILYCLGVTGVDPVENKLIFERFISKTRANSKTIDGIKYLDGSQVADIDSDFCTDRRSEVIDYLKNKYSGKFCKLPTISTLATRAAIKDVAKIFGRFTEDELNVITKSIPVKFGQPLSIEDSRLESKIFSDFANNNEDIIDCALTLEDMMRQKGTHASAYLIGHYDFDDYLPCELDLEGEIVCSFDMNYAQQETIKLDLLGLHGVTLISNIEKSLGIKLDDFDPNDPEIYSLSKSGDLSYGLFQLSGDINYKTFREVKPKNWAELADVIGLARPGAMSYISDYVKNEFNDYWGNVKMQEILGETHGVPIFQENLMRISNEVFEFSLSDANTLRKIVGKKQIDKVKEWEQKIYDAAEKLNLPKPLADFFWNLLLESASYSFCKCLDLDTTVNSKFGTKKITEIKIGDEVETLNTKTLKNEFKRVKNIHFSNSEVYEVFTDSGRKITCSMDHKFLCEDMLMRTLRDIIHGEFKIIEF